MIGLIYAIVCFVCNSNFFLKDLKDDESFGKLISFVSVIEFQKKAVSCTLISLFSFMTNPSFRFSNPPILIW